MWVRARFRTSRRPAVPQELVARAREALSQVERARIHAEQAAGSSGVALAWRREADASLDRAFQQADAVLREATRTARRHSYRAWMRWRSQLSWLDQQRQQHLFAVADRPALLQLGSIRAIDSGMTKPLIGEMAHGASKPAGAPARYGIDLEEVLRRTDALPTVVAQLAARGGRRADAAISLATAAARSAAPVRGSAAGDLPPAA